MARERMTYDVILRKRQNKYVARVREWPEVVIEEDSREEAITQMKAQLSEYLSQRPEVIQIDLEPVTHSRELCFGAQAHVMGLPRLFVAWQTA